MGYHTNIVIDVDVLTRSIEINIKKNKRIQRSGIVSKTVRTAVRKVKAVKKIHHNKTKVKGSVDSTPTRKQGESQHVAYLACAG